MTEDRLQPEDRALWRQATAAWRQPGDAAAAETLIAGYLDGRLDEDATFEAEALLAASPRLLDQALTARAALGATAAVPAALLARAEALWPLAPPSRPVRSTASPRRFAWAERRPWAVAAALRPWAVAAALALTVSLLGFELGRQSYGTLTGLLNQDVQSDILGISGNDLAM